VRAPLLQLQFTAQQRTYASRFPDAEHRIILVDGEHAGQLRLASLSGRLHVVDISLLPRFRRRGVGTAVYLGVIERAEREGRRVTAVVARSNPASLAFHTALGFSIEDETETSYSVRR